MLEPKEKSMIDIIIIGAGTAGLTAALYASRAGKSCLVLEKYLYGGQIVVSPHVENYPGISAVSGAEYAGALFEQAMSFGAQYRSAEVEGILPGDGFFTVITPQEQLECRSVIIATGTKNRPLGIAGEERLVGSGISFCADCDGAFYRNKDVAVVGGGNTALQDALQLSDLCRQVTLIHRRDSFRGEERTLSLLRKRTNVQILTDTVITALTGDPKLEEITLENSKTGQTSQLSVDGLFVAIGQIPQNQIFAGLLQLDSAGYIVADEGCRTSHPGIFCAGDCRTKAVRQLSTAAADGTVAALAACAWLE